MSDNGRSGPEFGRDECIHVAVVFDRNYVPWTAALVRSCLDRHPPGTVEFHAFHDGSVPAEDQERLGVMVGEAGAAIDFRAVPAEEVGDLPRTGAFDRIVWLRFLLPELLPDLGRLLYLDTDTLVTAPLQVLWATPLNGAPLGAVSNVVEPPARDHVRSLGITDTGAFLNSGVLLMDLEALRSEKLSDEVRRFVADHGPNMVWPDQDALNVIFRDRWTRLHPRWNAQNSLWTWPEWAQEVFDADELAEARSHPGIRHFEGPSLSKPWHYLCPHPWRDEFRATLQATPWAGTPLEDDTIGTRVIHHLPGGLQLGAYRALQRWRRRW